MKHLFSVVRNVRANGVMTLCRLNFKRTSSLLAIAGALAVAPAFGQESAKPEAKPIPKGQAVRVQGQPEPAGAQARPNNKGQVNQNQAQGEAPLIPECLEKLNLTAQQQEQVKEIVHNYDGSISMVWKQFGDRYMAAVCMETALMAAIEDSLTEPQRQQVREQRRKTARHEKAVAGTHTKDNQAAVKPNEETTKPANTGDAAEEGIAAAGVSLTDEQEMAADKVQEKYRSQLRSLNRDIQGLHTRLVSLEADKLTEIEKVLTKEQLSELRQHRQNAPAAPKSVASRNNAVKSE